MSGRESSQLAHRCAVLLPPFPFVVCVNSLTICKAMVKLYIYIYVCVCGKTKYRYLIMTSPNSKCCNPKQLTSDIPIELVP